MASAPAPELTELQARNILDTHISPAPPVATRGHGLWAFTWDTDLGFAPFPVGAPSWYVTDDSRCGSLPDRHPCAV